MTTKLHISPTLSLPLDFVTSTQAILAKKGKGKTYKASVQAEELLNAKQQVVAIDPTGAWWGLRSSSDGKSAGYPICIFGGEHADVPLEATAGEVIADAIASEHFSAVIDLTLFRKGEALRFMAAFLETLYRKNRNALHLFIDEADVVAPQKTFGPDEARVLGATEDIVRRGRIRGIGCTLITQRPQVLNKNVLSQVDMLTALGMNHPKDIGAIRDWVAVHGDEAQAKQMIADLPALPQGEAWVWAPSANIFKRITFRDRVTFDSGKTPKAGERIAAPKVLAPIDLARLGQTITATVEQQKQNDPKALKTRVAELEKQLAVKVKMPAAKVETKTIEKLIVKASDVAALEKLIARTETMGVKLDGAIQEIRVRVDDMGRALRAATRPNIPAMTPRPTPTPASAIAPKSAATREIRRQNIPAGDGSLTGPQRVLLTALAWWAAMGHESPTKAQLAGKAGWKPRGSNLRNRLSELHAAGLIEYPRSGEVSLTSAGAAIAPAPNTDDTLIDSIREELSGPQRTVFEELLLRGQRGRDSLAEALHWEPGGSNLRNRLSELSAMEIVEYPTKGSVALQPWVTA